MRVIIGAVVLALIGAAAGWAIAGNWAIQKTDRGAAAIVLDGGKTGKVPFPHKAHQDTLSVCEACHNLFPQKKGAIAALQDAGQLGKKDVMKQCQKCHRQDKNDGKKSGPIGCKDCHSIKG
ncbi:MAG: cytochrome c3 family protein [Pseudomonadota bacterium]